MNDWNPDLYRRFEAERTRPARDLLAAVPLAEATSLYDLGCGPGNSTELLVVRFPRARVVGTDNSQAMLESARKRLPQCRFDLSDIAVWKPDAPAPDLIYSNATLQWLPDHERLFPRLFSELAPGGVLAAQMPDNLDEPSHRLMRETAAEGPWSARLGGASAARTEILPLSSYYDLLARHAAQVDVWRTVYHHAMETPGAIVEWLRSTGLKPFLDPLPAAEQAAFLAQYEARIAQAYPDRADGRRLLAFPRVFIVARRQS